jgi:hypothetical protein
MWARAQGQTPLASRLRSSPELAARSDANFGIEGHQQLIESSVALVRQSTFLVSRQTMDADF